MATICDKGIRRAVETYTDEKNYLKYDDKDFIEVVPTASKRIHSGNAYGVAVSVAESLNNAINSNMRIGKVFYASNFQGKIGVSIQPTPQQLSLLNAPNEAAIQEAIDEWEQEKHQDELRSMEEASQAEMQRGGYSEDQRGEYFQKVLSNSTATPSTVAKVEQLLKQMGVDIVKLKDYAIANGIDVKGIAGIADLVQGVVAISEGVESTTLTEEMVHIATAIMEQVNPQLVTEMISKIDRFAIYKMTYDEYKDDEFYKLANGKPDIRKIKKEAVDKLITEFIINQNQGTNEFPELLNEENQNMITRWWRAILDFINGMYRKSNVTLFSDVAASIYAGDIGGNVSILSEDNIYLQKFTDKQKELQEKILDTQNTIRKVEATEPLDPLLSDDDQSNNWYEVFMPDGTWKRVANRVTDRVKRYYKQNFGKKEFTEEEKTFNEFKRTNGIKFHMFFEDIHGRYFNSDGTKKEFKAGRGFRLNNVDDQIYNKLEKYFVDLVEKYTIDGQAPLVLSETVLYDPTQKGGGEAGTIDLLMIDANNKAHILDWKFMTVYPGAKDIAWYKKGAYDVQLGRYKEILREVYGVKEFGMTRAIPVLMDISKIQPKNPNSALQIKGISIGSVTPTGIEPLTLVPVSEKTELTGIEQLDSLLVELNNLLKVIGREKVTNEEEKDFKTKRLNTISHAIRAAQSSLNILPLVNVILDIKKEGDIILDDYQMLYKDRPASSTDIENKQLSDFAEDLREHIAISDIFGNIQDSIGSLIYNPSMDELATTYKLQDLLRERKDLLARINKETQGIRENKIAIKKISGEFADKFIGQRNLVTGLLNPEAVIKGLSSWFDRTSEIPLAAMDILYKLVNSAKDRALKSSNADADRLLAIRKKIVDKGGDVRDVVKKLYQKDDKNKFVNKLIYKYSKDFYEKVDKNAEEGERNKTWLLENIDLDAYVKESLRIMNEKISYLKRRFPNDPEHLVELIAEERQKWDIADPMFNGWNNYLIKRFPKDTWFSQEYLELKKDGDLLELYNFIVEMNERAVELGYIENKYRSTFLPFIKKSMAESFAWDMSLSSIMSWGDALSVNAEDVGYGKINEVTKELEYGLPKYYTYDFSRKIDDEGNKIIDTSDVSEDLFKNMLLYLSHVNKYKEMSEIEGQLKLVKTVETFKSHLNTSTLGNVIIENGKPVELAGNEENAKLFEQFLRGVFYEQKYTLSDSDTQINLGVKNAIKKAINTVARKEVYTIDENPSGLSLVKTMDQTNRIFQLKTLGLDVITGAVNAFGMNVQLSTQSGNYFKYSEVAKNEAKLIGNKFKNDDEREMFIQSLEAFMPLKDDPMYDKIKEAGLTKLTRQNFGDMLMLFMRQPEQHIEKSVFLTVMDNTMVEDGKLVNIREYVKAKNKGRYGSGNYSSISKDMEAEIKELQKTRSLSSTRTLVDGKLVIPGLDLTNTAEITRLSNLVRRISRNASGTLTDIDRNRMSMNIWLKSMMVFKNWIPPLLKTRFGEFRKISDDFSVVIDENGLTTGEKYDIGRVRLWWYVIATSLQEKTSNVYNILTANAKGLEALDKMYEQFADDYQKRTGQPLNMTKDDFIDLIRNNLRNQMKEVALLLALIGLAFSAGFFAPDDDEDKATKNAFRYYQRAIDKFQSEISFFYDPREFDRMLSSGGIFPAIGLFSDLSKFITHTSMEITGFDLSDPTKDSEEVRENAQPVKNLAKMLPVTKSLLTYMAIISEDFAKEYDITIQKQPRQ